MKRTVKLKKIIPSINQVICFGSKNEQTFQRNKKTKKFPNLIHISILGFDTKILSFTKPKKKLSENFKWFREAAEYFAKSFKKQFRIFYKIFKDLRELLKIFAESYRYLWIFWITLIKWRVKTHKRVGFDVIIR